jgi:hypothetical protein
MIYDQLMRTNYWGDPVTDPTTTPAVPADAARAETTATVDVRNELNVMFDTWQSLTGRLGSLDAAGEKRVRAWLKDHLDL